MEFIQDGIVSGNSVFAVLFGGSENFVDGVLYGCCLRILEFLSVEFRRFSSTLNYCAFFLGLNDMSVVGGEMATPDRIKYIQGKMRIAIQNHQVSDKFTSGPLT